MNMYEGMRLHYPQTATESALCSPWRPLHRRSQSSSAPGSLAPRVVEGGPGASQGSARWLRAECGLVRSEIAVFGERKRRPATHQQQTDQLNLE